MHASLISRQYFPGDQGRKGIVVTKTNELLRSDLSDGEQSLDILRISPKSAPEP